MFARTYITGTAKVNRAVSGTTQLPHVKGRNIMWAMPVGECSFGPQQSLPARAIRC